MSILDLMLKGKSRYLLTYKDKSKFVVDTKEMLFDNYKWYKEMETLESKLTIEALQEMIKECSIKRIG